MPHHPSFTSTFHNDPYPSISPIQPSLSCKGRNVFITGGGRGIGRGIAENFLTAGANVFLMGRSETILQETCNELAKSCGDTSRVSYKAADILDAAAVRLIIDAGVEKMGSIDILISNAGYLDAHQPISTSDLNDYWKCFEVNVRGSLTVLQEFLRVAKLGATYINVSSGAAHILRNWGFSAYSSSKMAFARIVEFLSLERPELRLFNVQPGAIKTDMASKAPELNADDDISKSSRTRNEK